MTVHAHSWHLGLRLLRDEVRHPERLVGGRAASRIEREKGFGDVETGRREVSAKYRGERGGVREKRAHALCKLLAQTRLDDLLRLDKLVPRQVLQAGPVVAVGRPRQPEDDVELVDLVLSRENGTTREELEEDASARQSCQ